MSDCNFNCVVNIWKTSTLDYDLPFKFSFGLNDVTEHEAASWNFMIYVLRCALPSSSSLRRTFIDHAAKNNLGEEVNNEVSNHELITSVVT